MRQWGFDNAYDIDKVHLDYCKRLLRVKKATPNVMVYTELGRLPLQISRKIKIIKYWLKLLETDNCILQSIYSYMLEKCKSTTCNRSIWLVKVKHILLTLGFADVWFYQSVKNKY